MMYMNVLYHSTSIGVYCYVYLLTWPSVIAYVKQKNVRLVSLVLNEATPDASKDLFIFLHAHKAQMQ
jgi:hypothetical protein